MGTFYDSPNDYRNYLAHHGIKNQKWGVRHGPPYPLGSGTSARIKKGIKVAAKKGSEVYNKSVKPRAQAIAKKGAAVYDAKMPESGKKVINAAAKKTKEVYEVNKAMAKNAASNYKKNYEATHKTLQDEGKITGKPGSKTKSITKKDVMWDVPYKDWKENKRATDAAKLGLEALKKRIYSDVGDPNDPGEQNWFLFEDQTQLMPAIADLVNQGKSKEEIVKAFDDMLAKSDPEHGDTADWYLNEFWGKNQSGDRIMDFIDDCIEVRDGSSKPQPRKEDIDISTLPVFEQKYVTKAYRVYNPEGFAHYTVQTHKERKSHTSDIWDFDNGIDDVIVDRAIWHPDNMTDKKTKERLNRLNSFAMNDKQASKLQTAVLKNNSKIKSTVIDSMSNAIFEEGWSGANNASEIKNALSNSEFGVVTRAFAYHSVPESKYPGYISMSVSASAEQYVGDHILTQEILFNPSTGDIKILEPHNIQMDG